MPRSFNNNIFQHIPTSRIFYAVIFLEELLSYRSRQRWLSARVTSICNCYGKCLSLGISIFLYFFSQINFVHHENNVHLTKLQNHMVVAHPVTVAPLVTCMSPLTPEFIKTTCKIPLCDLRLSVCLSVIISVKRWTETIY